MRDYKFGEWLAALRSSNGYSQFQLGRLLGVSDKAVSKWETGAAKPRTATCEKMASLYGMTLDELISCQQAHGISRIDGDQGKAEESLWAAARERLQRIYGEKPPMAFISRLDSEEMLMRGTGMIEHLHLKAMLWRKGIRCNDWFIQDTSLTAWLLGAAMVNPLPPHTVCPHCKKTILHPEVPDGWDLQEETCGCGHSLIRDGHNIPLALTEKRFVEMDRRVYISISPKDEPTLQELIRTQYQNRWEMSEYTLAKGELTFASLFEIHLRFFFLAPAGTRLPFPVVNGVYQLPSDDYILRVTDIPETLLYIIEDPMGFDQLAKQPIPTLPGIDDLLKPELFSQAREEIRTVSGLTIGDFGDLRMRMKLKSPDEDLSSTGLKEVTVYHEDDISDVLPDPISFSVLMRCTPPSGFDRLWHGFIREVVRDGTVSLADFPVSQEDLFDRMKQQLLRVGIQDSGIALKAFASMREDGPSPEIAQALLSIGCEPWLPAYIEYICKNEQLESKTYLVIAAYCCLCRLVLNPNMEVVAPGRMVMIPKAEAMDDDDNDEERTDSPVCYMSYEAIMQAAMMKHAAEADNGNRSINR